MSTTWAELAHGSVPRHMTPATAGQEVERTYRVASSFTSRHRRGRSASRWCRTGGSLSPPPRQGRQRGPRDPALLDTTLPLEVVSCGVPFLFVPVKSLEAIRAIRFRLDVWERVLRDFAAPHVFVFTQEVVLPDSTVHSRMFAPAMGIAEDPATGAASGPLGCYLVRHGLVQPAEVGSSQMVSEQGFELGRPSLVQVKIELDGQHITDVSIGGQCYFMGKGWITLAE